ncbi:nucleotidyltransferase family protein [candidate division TA06 bacterium]|uniref:Nucleotidyltransferase family protein n=1 Tax=candidate division TA06 bacterium TaxID=2250710 RepID=A0A933MJK7_UNCT6|nr:nucleotidyltransferase family protein [candidate division TA06 bacterium]
MPSLRKIKTLIGQHKNELAQTFKVRQIGVFGSRVNGRPTQKSDIDIIVDFSGPVSLLKLVNLENYLSDLFAAKVDLVPKEDLRIELKEQILSRAVFL